MGCYKRLTSLTVSIKWSVFLLLLIYSGLSMAIEVDLTRHLNDMTRTSSSPGYYSASFFGTEGAARLIITNGNDAGNESRVTSAIVTLNGEQVLGPDDFKKKTARIEVPVYLLEDNLVEIESRGKPGSTMNVRVKQVQDVNLNIVSRIHFQVNTSNFDVSKSFNELFGFLFWLPFPPTNTLEVAQAVGLDHPYLINVEVGLMLTSADGGLFGAPAIDLIEWFVPRRLDPPYAEINHLGMARVALKTKDLDADMATLQFLGVNFLTQPAASGKRFAIFKDPDGTYYELVEDTSSEPAFPYLTSVNGVAHVNVNVSDFERSREFYKMLGYTGSQGPAYIDTPEVADLLGMQDELSIEGELIQHPVDGSVIELVEWKYPHNPEGAYPPPINHLGINRVAYFTLDLKGDVNRLKAQGVEFLSEIAPCCEGPASTSGIVAFYDPDGTFIELLGAITPP